MPVSVFHITLMRDLIVSSSVTVDWMTAASFAVDASMRPTIPTTTLHFTLRNSLEDVVTVVILKRGSNPSVVSITVLPDPLPLQQPPGDPSPAACRSLRTCATQ